MAEIERFHPCRKSLAAFKAHRAFAVMTMRFTPSSDGVDYSLLWLTVSLLYEKPPLLVNSGGIFSLQGIYITV